MFDISCKVALDSAACKPKGPSCFQSERINIRNFITAFIYKLQVLAYRTDTACELLTSGWTQILETARCTVFIYNTLHVTPAHKGLEELDLYLTPL